MAEGWCTLESDPGVFTELLNQVGVRGVQVDELYSLEESEIRALEPVYGLIFLFKWRPDEQDRGKQRLADGGVMETAGSSNVFFANQVINNACATQAILSIVLNIEETADSSGPNLGDELRNFKEFTSDFDAQLRGLAISNSEVIRKAHNSFAPPNQFVVEDSKKEGDDDDVYHFISFMPVNGKLYELDGLKEGPISLGECTKDSWLQLLIPALQKRIEEYSSNEIRFNLMALIRNRKELYEEELSTLSNLENSARKDELRSLIANEDAKRTLWKKDNARRKFNYTPFIVELLKVLASKGELNKMITKASDGDSLRTDKSASDD